MLLCALQFEEIRLCSITFTLENIFFILRDDRTGLFESESNFTNLEGHAHSIVLTQRHKLIELVKFDLVLCLFLSNFGFAVFFALAFSWDLTENIVREDGRRSVLVEVATAGFAHDFRENTGKLLNDKQDQESCDSNTIQSGVNLFKSVCVNSSQCCNNYSDYLGIFL